MEIRAGYTIRRAVLEDKSEIEKIWRESLGGMINWAQDSRCLARRKLRDMTDQAAISAGAGECINVGYGTDDP